MIEKFTARATESQGKVPFLKRERNHALPKPGRRCPCLEPCARALKSFVSSLLQLDSGIMRVKRLVIAFVALLLAGGLGLLLFGQQREPSWKARKLSQWVIDYGKNRIDKTRNWESEEAIRHIGTAAIPFLMEWMENKELAIAARGLSTVGKQFSDHPDWDLTYLNQQRADCAAMAFSILGSEARTVIPEFAECMVTSGNDYRATQAAKVLANIGALALPELVRNLTNQSIVVRQRAAFAISYMASTNAQPATGTLIRAIDDPDTSVAGLACLTLSRQRSAPDVVIPILTRMLTDAIPARRVIAAGALARYGALPKTYIPNRSPAG
jgi:hypothetical protein